MMYAEILMALSFNQYYMVKCYLKNKVIKQLNAS